jgi:hypothetical protein
MGLGASLLIFPLLVAAAGVAGVFMSLDASSARSKFRRDGKAAAQSLTPEGRPG